VREACGDAVRYFDPLKAETLVEAMRMISADATLRRELTHAGYDNAKRFSWDGSAVVLLNMLAASRA
jgi:hypothetical protein